MIVLIEHIFVSVFSITLSSFLEKTSLIIIHLISYKKIIGRDFIIYSNIVKSFSFFYLFNVGLRLTESRKSLCVFFSPNYYYFSGFTQRFDQ